MTKAPSVLLRLSLGLLALLLLAGSVAWYQWTTFKREQGIVQLDWQGMRVSSQGLAVRQLTYEQVTGNGLHLALKASGITLDIPSFLRVLPLQSLQIGHIEIDLRSLPEAQATQTEPVNLQQYQQWAAWLPQRLNIVDLHLALPCAKGRCDERGSLQLQHAGESLLPLEGRLTVHRNDHKLSLLISAQRLDTENTLIEADLLIDEQPRLEARNQLSHDMQALQWNGTMAMGSLPEAPWLLDWLGEWTSYEPTPLPELPADMRIGAGWALSLPKSASDSLDWPNAAGDLRLSGHLPAPWPVIGLGELQGDIDLAAHGQNGLWLPTELRADLKLRPVPALVADLPQQLRPTQLSIKIVPIDTDSASGQLPVQLRLDAQGGAPASLQARVQLATTPPYALAIEQARLQLRSASLQLDALSLRGLDAGLDFSGHAELERVDLQLLKTSRVTLANLAIDELAASQLQVNLSQPLRLRIERNDAEPSTWRAQGPLDLRLGRLEHPQLIAQGWRWNSQLDIDTARLSGTGPLSNDAGLSVATSLNKPWNGALQVSGKLQEIFLRAGNPIARSFTAWPAALELNSGRLLADGRFSLPTGNGRPSANFTLEARGWRASPTVPRSPDSMRGLPPACSAIVFSWTSPSYAWRSSTLVSRSARCCCVASTAPPSISRSKAS